jgi:hypothetical protein
MTTTADDGEVVLSTGGTVMHAEPRNLSIPPPAIENFAGVAGATSQQHPSAEIPSIPQTPENSLK